MKTSSSIVKVFVRRNSCCCPHCIAIPASSRSLTSKCNGISTRRFPNECIDLFKKSARQVPVEEPVIVEPCILNAPPPPSASGRLRSSAIKTGASGVIHCACGCDTYKDEDMIKCYSCPSKLLKSCKKWYCHKCWQEYLTRGGSGSNSKF